MEFPEPKLFRAEVVAVEALSPRVRGITLATLGPDALHWVPGQYIELGLPGDERRMPYSIASAPDVERPGRLELAVVRGSGSGLFEDLAVGSSVEVFGPKGRFVRVEAEGPDVFVGTGTGVAPLRAMMNDPLSTGSGPRLLLFGVRAEPEILWRAELEERARREPGFRLEVTLSQPQNGWTGRRGRVQDHLSELVAPLRDARVYVCGLSEMVADCVRELTGPLGFPAERVITEAH